MEENKFEEEREKAHGFQREEKLKENETQFAIYRLLLRSSPNPPKHMLNSNWLQAYDSCHTRNFLWLPLGLFFIG